MTHPPYWNIIKKNKTVEDNNENTEGKIKNATKLRNFRSIDKVSEAKIPKVKLLDNTYVDYDDYDGPEKTTLSSPFDGMISTVSDEMLPF